MTQQNLLAQAQGSIALGLIQVYRALGGGWQIRCTGCEPNELPPQAAPRPLTGTAPTPQAESLPPAPDTPAAGPPRARLGLPLVKR